jgi:hypothetical protein
MYQKENVSCVVGMRNSYRVLFEKKKEQKKKDHLRKPNSKWWDNIRADIEEEAVN